MIKVLDVKVPIDFSRDAQINAVASFLKVKLSDIKSIKILKKSIDARNKKKIAYNCNFAVEIDEKLVKNAFFEKYTAPERLKTEKIKRDVVVVGSGPSGLFSAYVLAKSGANVTLVEKGEIMEKRIISVETYKKTSKLNPLGTIQEGEGGAGTFSDGKLNTGIGSPLVFEVLSIFVDHGASDDILYESRPHVGTDIIREVVVNMRESIMALGGKFMFETEFVDFKKVENKVQVVCKKGKEEITLDCDDLVLGLGYSARKTHRVLFKRGMEYRQKAFSVGYRIEHLQSDINISQYGSDDLPLPPAEYKLATHFDDGRGVYTFCMCPGGEVVPAVSKVGEIVTNGMSYHDRGGKNSNSAILVSVFESDYGSDHPLAGMDFQEKLEKEAYEKGRGEFMVSNIKDFLEGKESYKLGKVKPTIKPRFFLGDVGTLLPKVLVDDIKKGIVEFTKKIKCFDDGVLTGIETRSSAPFMVPRAESLETNISNIYMVGEGAGMAGGIVSSAVDGIKVALKIIEKADKL